MAKRQPRREDYYSWQEALDFLREMGLNITGEALLEEERAEQLQIHRGLFDEIGPNRASLSRSKAPYILRADIEGLWERLEKKGDEGDNESSSEEGEVAEEDSGSLAKKKLEDLSRLTGLSTDELMQAGLKKLKGSGKLLKLVLEVLEEEPSIDRIIKKMEELEEARKRAREIMGREDEP